MMNIIKNTFVAGLAALIFSAAPDAIAQTNSGPMNHDNMNHGTMNHGNMNHDAMPGHANAAEVPAKINTVDADSGLINVSHGPVEALGWPSMTMDLPVTRRVDLSTVKPGDDVILSLKQGRDKQYRVIDIMPK